MVGRPLTLLALCIGLASAWMPGVERDLFNDTGHNMFRRFEPRGSSANKRWLPGSENNSRGKIRGVDLGSLFVFEPWMASDIWANNIGCGNQNSEFDCVNYLGQSQANTVFQAHWSSWITQSDIQKMADYGLNTVRIPVGYWMYEDIVYSSEYFPQGGFDYLLQVCDWAREQGFYIIIDLHGAPYSQSASPNPDTGQYRDPGFYSCQDCYNRAQSFLSWMTTQIHTNSQMANVGMLEILNEPVQNSDNAGDLLTNYYPGAWNAIRNAESSLEISSNNQLHIQMMNALWGTGNPDESLPSTYFAAYDDHRYLKYAGVADEQSAYLDTSCNDNRGGNTPTIVGEWCLSTSNNEWDPSSNMGFYQDWWAAQVMAYEKQDGWIFWTWKTSGLNDPRWDYSMAVQQGIISSDPDDAYNNDICNNYG